jgi:hypothetical protein
LYLPDGNAGTSTLLALPLENNLPFYLRRTDLATLCKEGFIQKSGICYCRKWDELQLQTLKLQHQELARQIASIGFIWPGSIQWRWKVCGKPNCACSKDPGARHGPYPYWTTKVNGKTVNRRLGHEEAILIEQWIENRREVESIMAEMKVVSDQALSIAVKCNVPLPEESGPIP